jgi:anaerobic magnesium-protoporphyrin IX monomethyl ester cyclase
MRVMFVGLGVEQLAVGLFTAILRRAGHTVGLAFSPHLFDDRYWLSMPGLAGLVEDEDHVLDQIRRFKPDVLCCTPLTVTYRWMVGVARRAKDACGVTTVFGGIHASAVPEVVLEEPAVDYVCVGEGDVALPLLLDALEKGRADRPMPNVWFRGARGGIVRGPLLPFLHDLDSLPGFEKDLWLDHVPVREHYMTMSMRGCIYRCTFCFNNFFADVTGEKHAAAHYVRQRSVDHFLAELKEAKRRHRMRYIHIKDDIFTVHTPWLKEFSEKYRREVGVPFYCLSHPQHLDGEKIAALKEAGCTTIQFGVESADDDYKKNELRRYENEGHVGRVMELLDKAGIERKVDHIFGLPGEKIEAQEQALRLYSRHRVERIGINWFVYIPGTEIVRNGLRNGFITQDHVDRLNRGDGSAFLQSRAFVDKRHLKDYLCYEFLFRVFPLLPEAVRRRVRVAHVRWLPAWLLRAAGVCADVLAALLLKDNSHLLFYVHLYKKGLFNRLRRALGLGDRSVAELPPLPDPAWRRFYDGAAEEALGRVAAVK